MMLPTDMVLLWDRSFKKHVDVYAADQVCLAPVCVYRCLT